MSFNHLAAPPDPETYINLQSVGDIARRPLAPRKLFEQEAAYWRRGLPRADTIGASCAASVLEETGYVLGMYRNLALACQRIKELDEDLQYDTYRLLRKQAGVLALSRLMRELAVVGAAESPLYTAADVTLVFDIPPIREVGNAALHLALDTVGDYFSAPEEAESTWFEGKSIMVEVVRPARPSESMIESHLARNAKVFKQTHASAIPRLKTSVWESGAALPVRKQERKRRPKPQETVVDAPELPAEFRLPKEERSTFNDLTRSFTNGRSDEQAGWRVEGTTKDAAKNSLGILRWLGRRLPPGADAEPATLAEQLSSIPTPLLKDSLTALLLNRNKTPKWPDLVRMLREHWPHEYRPVDWDTVHGVLELCATEHQIISE